MKKYFSRNQTIVCLTGAMLVLGALVCYWPVRHFDFVYLDDGLYVYQCPMVRRGLTWPGFVWAFKSVDGGDWNPLVWLSHMMDCQFYGLNPGGHHMTNVLLHAANALLLFLILENMTRAFWRSALVAAIFAWHPMHVESVAWISERKDVLSTLFLLLTLWAYARFVKAGSPRRKGFYGLALFLFALGLMSKPMLVTAPFLFLLLDYWPLQRTEPLRKLVLEKLPFLALSATACALAIWAQQSAGALWSAPWPVRLGNAAVSYVTYLEKLFWPVNLTVSYPYPHSIQIGQIGGAVVLLGAISWVVSAGMKKRRYLAVGWFWFLGALAPVIGLLQVGMQAYADRYTYVPYIGLALMISWGAADLAATWPRTRFALVCVIPAALSCCVAAARSQLAYWRDSPALFEHALSITPDNYVANAHLGLWEATHGRLDDAIKHFRTAIRLNPTLARPYDGLGKALALQHHWDDAMAIWKEAMRVAPNDATCLNDLAWVYATSPKPELRNGPEAVRLAIRACELTDRQRPELLDTLAAAYAETGRFSEAMKTTEEIGTVAISTQDPAAANLARQRMALYQAGKPYRDDE